MNALHEFFRKYHAVPGGSAGPDWSRASAEALVGWATDDAALWDRDPACRPHITARMIAVRDELWERLRAFGEVDVANEPEERKPIRRAWYGACTRVGFGPTT